MVQKAEIHLIYHQKIWILDKPLGRGIDKFFLEIRLDQGKTYKVTKEAIRLL